MSRILDLLIGRNGVSPIAVRLARGALEVALLAALGFLIVSVQLLDLGEYSVLSPFVLMLLQQLEGPIDNYIDPSQNRSIPPSVGGGTGASFHAPGAGD